MKGFLALAGLGLFCWQCIGNPGGGSSEAEGFTLSGRIVDSAQRPLSGAKVALFDDKTLHRADSQALVLDSARTDAEGWWALKGVRKGRYTLLATTDGADGAERAALRSGIELAEDDTLEAMSAGQAASLAGSIPTGFPYSHAVHMALLETPYRSPIAGDGTFSMDGIAPGTYILALVLRSNFTFADPSVLGTLDTITVAPGDHLDIDSPRVPALAGSAPFLVDGFSDCDRLNPQGGEWWSTNDRGSGGNSRVHAFTFVDPGDGTGGCAARFTFTFGQAATYPFVGIGTYFLAEVDSAPRAVSLENASGFSFRAKGRGAGLEVLLQSSVSGLVSGQGFDIDAVPGAWATYTVDFLADMKNTYDSTDIHSWRQRRKAITHIQFDAIPVSGVDSGEVWIDDVRLLPP